MSPTVTDNISAHNSHNGQISDPAATLAADNITAVIAVHTAAVTFLRLGDQRDISSPLPPNGTSVRYGGGVHHRYSNQIAAPKNQPRRPQGNFPVIVRLVHQDNSEEWRPSVVIRFTDTAVLAGWQQEPGNPRSVIHIWLPVDDVARVIHRPAATG